MGGGRKVHGRSGCKDDQNSRRDYWDLVKSEMNI